MCGIFGLLGDFDSHLLTSMGAQMSHRGPDGNGTWHNEDAKIHLGHVRLSIIDLESGSQPMSTADGRYTIVFNGEIYNYQDLRAHLEGQGWTFHSASDTEVLLAGLILEGPDFLHRTIGMFALALWDNGERNLFLARDRMGIKPLYIAELPQGLAFASELKSLLGLPGVNRSIDQHALNAYLSVRYVPAPLTMVQGIRKFPAAHCAHIKLGETLSPKRWWDIEFQSPNRSMTTDEQEQLDWLLRDATRLCMVSDVPYGAFLSGGVDSGLITGLMAQQASEPVKTYSIGFEGLIDERDEARATASAIGTDHHDWELTPKDFQKLPHIAKMVDEPFPDPIVLAMDMLAEHSQKNVKVILTGEGADELFGGYVHHPHMKILADYGHWLPKPLRHLGAAVTGLIPPACTDLLFDYPVPPGRKGRDRLANLVKYAGDEAGRYFAYVSIFHQGERKSLLNPDLITDLQDTAQVRDTLLRGDTTYMDRLWTCEHKHWLVDNILFKQDKTLMANSVEGRVPFCDHRLVEFAAKLPFEARLKNGKRKVALREAAKRLVPELPEQTMKKAFMIPMDGQYGKVIRELAGDVLNSLQFRNLNLLQPSAMDALLNEFPSPSFLVGKQILSLMMFGLWADQIFSLPTNTHDHN